MKSLHKHKQYFVSAQTIIKHTGSFFFTKPSFDKETTLNFKYTWHSTAAWRADTCTLQHLGSSCNKHTTSFWEQCKPTIHPLSSPYIYVCVYLIFKHTHTHSLKCVLLGPVCKEYFDMDMHVLLHILSNVSRKSVYFLPYTVHLCFLSHYVLPLKITTLITGGFDDNENTCNGFCSWYK